MTGFRAVILVSVLAIMGCGTSLKYTPQPTAGDGGIAVLFSAPQRPHEIVGVIEWEYYRPGFRAPMITDAMPELQSKARAAGGDAVIVTKNAVDPLFQRTLYISANVIKYVQPDATSAK